MARNKKIKGRRVEDKPHVEVEYKPDFNTYKYTDKYQGTPVIFCECRKCGKNYELISNDNDSLYFQDNDEAICLYCQNDMQPPSGDYILGTDMVIDSLDYDEYYLIDEYVEEGDENGY